MLTYLTFELGIMLLSRPFFIYDVYEYLGVTTKQGGTRAENEEKRKFADAAIDAAKTLVMTLRTVINNGCMPFHAPLIVYASILAFPFRCIYTLTRLSSWLLNASLVLNVSLLGRFELSSGEHCRASVACMEHFSVRDAHAQQYLGIVQALHKAITTHTEQRTSRLQTERRLASSQLFGLLTNEPRTESSERSQNAESTMPERPEAQNEDELIDVVDGWSIYDANFFSVPWLNQKLDESLKGYLQPGRLDGSLADIPLFPMNDLGI